MKKSITLLLCALCALCTQAQMRYKLDSFRDLSANNRAASAADLGSYNTLANTLRATWPTDADGNDNLALLIIGIENIHPDDVSLITPKLNKGLLPVGVTPRIIDGRNTLFVYIPEAKGVEVLLQHPKFGALRLPAHDLKAHNIYLADVINQSTLSVSVTSEPANSAVYWDGIYAGRTPLTIPDVTMGLHNISLTPTDPQVAEPVKERVVEVSSSQSAFNFPMYRERDVVIVPDPQEAFISVFVNGQAQAEGYGTQTLHNVRFGTPLEVEGKYKNDVRKERLQVDAFLPARYNMRIVGMRPISFTAVRNNSELPGATVYIGGREIGKTPCVGYLEDGVYSVNMSYEDYGKDGKLKVTPSTREFRLRIPAAKKPTPNPFQTDYDKHILALSLGYVNRAYSFKVNGKSYKYKFTGVE